MVQALLVSTTFASRNPHPVWKGITSIGTLNGKFSFTYLKYWPSHNAFQESSFILLSSQEIYLCSQKS